MNVRGGLVNAGVSKPPRFTNVSFNQDGSCFSCAMQTGFEVFSTDPLVQKLSKKFKGTDTGIGLTKMLHRTNYTALVGGSKRPRYPLNNLIIWDDLQKKESKTLKFMSPVKNVFLSRTYIVVVLENSLELYDFQQTPSKICPSLEIASAAAVDFVICPAKNVRRGSMDMQNGNAPTVSGIIAFSSARMVGQIHIANLPEIKSDNENSKKTQLLPTSIIRAHKSPIRLVRFNNQGTMLATCSAQGTLIRIFNTNNGALLKEFRRGLDRADIYDMVFSPRGSRLAVISDKQTLHIFQVTTSVSSIGQNANFPNQSDDKTTEYGKNKVHLLREIVPKMFKPKYIDSIWSMCSIHLKDALAKDEENSSMNREFMNDRCKIGWCRDSSVDRNMIDEDEDSLVLVWKNRGIWEKYVMLEKEQPGNLTPGSQQLEQPAVKKWELVRESWREI